MTVKDFLAQIEAIRALAPKYGAGHTGDDGLCDCIGLIIGAVERCGVKWDGVHGSNWWARHYTDWMLLISGVDELSVGDLVYKGRSPGSSGYDLPERYADHPDQVDYYHVGVVTGVNPLRITHCTKGGGVDGITVDTKRGNWMYFGKLKLLESGETTNDKEAVPLGEMATVYAENGVDVNFRKKPAKTGALIDRIKVGTVVTVVSRENGWAKIVTAKGVQGYMMEQYLRFAVVEDDQGGDDLAAILARLNELEERIAALEGGIG